MKSIFVTLLCALTLVSTAQKKASADDAGRIALATYVPQTIEGMPAAARSMLTNKLNRIATSNGIGGSPLNQRFIITANVQVASKEVTATAPPMQALKLDVTLYIGDGISGTLFTSTSITVKGVGTTEIKAYKAALKNINTRDARFKTFIEEGKQKIIDYFNAQCDVIIKEADVLAAASKYDAAIAQLVSIPQSCNECYNKALDKVKPLVEKQLDFECKQHLAEAKTAWASGQDADAARKASSHLGQINPQAACYSEAQQLTADIAKRIKELDQREWDFKLKEQQDGVDLEKATIQAAKEVGVAYGKNQPQNVTYNTRGWY